MASATGILESYRLPQDEQTLAARYTAVGERPSPLEFHKFLDWSPSEVWDGSRRQAASQPRVGHTCPTGADARPHPVPEYAH